MECIAQLMAMCGNINNHVRVVELAYTSDLSSDALMD